MPCCARTSRRMRSAAVGVLELREDERVDPLGVRRPVDPLREVGTDVAHEVEPHAGELAQVAVVCEGDRRAVEAERMQVRLGDQLALAVGDAADVRDQARRRELAGEAAQVPVERRERRHAVDEGLLLAHRVRLPGDHPEARKVEERVHHPRAVGLADERAVGVEQHVPQGERLSEIGEHAAHRAIVRRADSLRITDEEEGGT
jgi:hypothetical protein